MVAGSPKITSNWAKFALLGRLFSCYAIIAADKNDTSPSKINMISFGLRVFFVARFVKRNSFSNHFIGSIRIITHIWTWLSFNCDRAVSIRFDGSFLLLTGSVIGHGIGMGFFQIHFRYKHRDFRFSNTNSMCDSVMPQSECCQWFQFSVHYRRNCYFDKMPESKSEPRVSVYFLHHFE